MVSEEDWRATDYFQNFHCKGGACRNSCCEGWQIAVNMQDYFAMVGMDCPPELHHRIECAFSTPEKVSPDHYRVISPPWLGLCPLHDEDGLCMLHRHCGEAALPEVCRVYPRSLKCEGGENRACCSGSCEAVAEALMRPEPLQIVSVRMQAKPEYSQAEAPDFSRRNQECLDLLQDRRWSLRRRILSIVDHIMEEKTEIPHEIGDDQRKKALAVLMNALQTLAEESASLQRFGEAAFERYSGEKALENYDADVRAMEKAFPQWQEWLENLMANHFFYACVPCADERLAQDQCAPGVALLYATLRALCAAQLAKQPTRETFADVCAGILRMAEHSAFYYNAHILIPQPRELLHL